MSVQIECYFDPISPYAWLATTQLERIRQESGAEIIMKPILFAGLLNAHGGLGPAEVPAMRNYIFRDILRRAQRLGLTAECPPQHPFNPLLALRICTALEDEPKREQLACAFCNAAWLHGQDITDEQTVRKIVEDCGLDPNWALTMAKDQAVKKQLADTTQEAVDKGIFGVPSFYVDGQIFWGEDRIADLLRYLAGSRIDEDKLQDILSRKAAVVRRR